MARVPYINQSDLPAEYRDLLTRPANVFRALANSPELLRAYLQFGMWIRTECALDARLRELAILQVSYMMKNEYEYSHHVKIGGEYGVSNEDIRALIASNEGRPNGLGEVERLVLDASRQMTDDGAISDDVWLALSSHLDAARMVELVMIVTFYGCNARVLSTLQVDVEPEYAHYLTAFPLEPSKTSIGGASAERATTRQSIEET
ncbi:carboxymuconolactone decarboxylase family protein [Pseudarthrobacter sulfonivorans]|uniref:carboxymuconolactone decarboxylase family protein n=1 Tax=Pseudarthrobacter sulfonivorans TaxID=121292 RepID=UPI0009FA52C8|nr:carboxymuconolactone decarboxylase family protein [Pseudarthrobacter sulfonivorans]